MFGNQAEGATANENTNTDDTNTNDQDLTNQDQNAGGGEATNTNDNGDDDQNDGDNAGDNGEGDDDGEEFLFDGQAVASPASDDDDQDGDTDLVKRLRAQLRENKRQAKESAQQQQQKAAVVTELPSKPQMGDEGIDWDPEKYAEAIEKWHTDKAQMEAHQAEQGEKVAAFKKRFSEKQVAYQAERAIAVKRIAGFEKAEQAVADLPEPLQAAFLLTSQKPTLAVMAIARNADLRKQVEEAYNTDHIALGYLIADIDRRAGTAPKAKKDVNGAPEVKGQNGVANVGQLEALRKKAEETGDYTAYLAAKNRKK